MKKIFKKRRHGSLRRRLLILALSTVVVVWLAAATYTYFDAREEFGEILDAHLAQTASLLVIQASHELDEVETEHTPLLHKYSLRVAFQVWEDGRLLRLHSANAPGSPLSDRERGFSNKVIDGNRWRVFSTWDNSGINLIQVAELTKDREELSRAVVSNLLVPLWFSLPVLAFLLWLSVTRSLRPLDKLTGEVAQREPDNLAPLNAGIVPREVVPLIERLNSLFVRIDASIQKERRFTADAAHELRTPVAAIKAQAQVARAASNDIERNHALDSAIAGCDRAAHLIDQLLTLARIDTLGAETTEPCQLREIASEMIATMAPAALTQEVRLELMEGEDMTVQGNPVLLRILLRNLIDNAVSHTASGTAVNINITMDQEQICLSVSDNGPGIAESELDKLGERFYRPLGTSASGSGLGLSIVKRIAEIHSAAMQFSSRKNGSGFSVSVLFKS